MYSVSNRFKHLSIWSQWMVLFGQVMDSLEGVALVEETHHWGRLQRAAGLSPFQSSLSVSCVQMKIQPSAS